MTPKEKATELVHKFYISLPNNGSLTGLNNINSRWNEGKKCALMAVDEIIEELLGDWGDNQWRANERIGYWKEVKEEIEKIK